MAVKLGVRFGIAFTAQTAFARFSNSHISKSVQYTALCDSQIGVHINIIQVLTYSFINICHRPKGHIFTAPNSCIYQILISILLQTKWFTFIVIFFKAMPLLLFTNYCYLNRVLKYNLHHRPSTIPNYWDDFPIDLFQLNLTTIIWQFSNETCQFNKIGLICSLHALRFFFLSFWNKVLKCRTDYQVEILMCCLWFMNCSYQCECEQEKTELMNGISNPFFNQCVIIGCHQIK